MFNKKLFLAALLLVAVMTTGCLGGLFGGSVLTVTVTDGGQVVEGLEVQVVHNGQETKADTDAEGVATFEKVSGEVAILIDDSVNAVDYYYGKNINVTEDVNHPVTF